MGSCVSHCSFFISMEFDSSWDFGNYQFSGVTKCEICFVGYYTDTFTIKTYIWMVVSCTGPLWWWKQHTYFEEIKFILWGTSDSGFNVSFNMGWSTYNMKSDKTKVDGFIFQYNHSYFLMLILVLGGFKLSKEKSPY